jgi:hypothetical protein
VAAYDTQAGSFAPSRPRAWFQNNQGITSPFDVFTMMPDGKRMVVLLEAGPEEEHKPQTHMTLLLNFFDELRRRIPPGGK